MHCVEIPADGPFIGNASVHSDFSKLLQNDVEDDHQEDSFSESACFLCQRRRC